MCLYPNTITSLRHEWEHPAFAETQSKQWLEWFADSLDLSVSTLLEAARNYVATGESLLGGSNLEGADIPDEFWDHFENVTRQKVPHEERGYFFTCSC